MSWILKNTLVISSLGHLMAFGLFSFSFDQSKFQNQESSLIFWGQILPKAALDVKSLNTPLIGRAVSEKLETVLPKSPNLEFYMDAQYSLKPQVELNFNEQKTSFVPPSAPVAPLIQKKTLPIMIHPLLPYQLQLYFKDRQAVHIELMFKIVSNQEKDTILIERKISSGNLEADLLSSRYINHYLFIQQTGFPRNAWQTVKIDLSAGND